MGAKFNCGFYDVDTFGHFFPVQSCFQRCWERVWGNIKMSRWVWDEGKYSVFENLSFQLKNAQINYSKPFRAATLNS